MKKIKYKIKRFFQKKKEEDLLKLASCIYGVYGKNDEKLNIHLIKIKRRFFFYGVYKFVIYSSRPGIIIGRKGKDYYSLLSLLEKEYKKKIKLEIKEHTPISIISHYDEF